MREETRSDSRQPLSAISVTRDVNDSPGRGNFNVVYWWVELCFFPCCFPDSKEYKLLLQSKQIFTKRLLSLRFLSLLLEIKSVNIFSLLAFRKYDYISTRQTYTSGKCNSRDLAWYGLFSFSDTSSSQIIIKETVSRTIEPSWQNTCLNWQTYFRSGQVYSKIGRKVTSKNNANLSRRTDIKTNETNNPV